MTCPNKNSIGVCQAHNLHCGWPTCETINEPVVKKKPDYVIINGMHFSHSEILEWREKEVAYRDRHADDVAVDVFAQAMKNKLAEKRAQGFNGWDNKELCTDEFLAQLLVKSVSKGDPVDIGNFAMMLFARDVTMLTIKEAALNDYVTYHSVLDQAKRKAKEAMGLIELPKMLVEIYVDMQHNGSRYTEDRRKSTEARLLTFLTYPEDMKKVSNEF